MRQETRSEPERAPQPVETGVDGEEVVDVVEEEEIMTVCKVDEDAAVKVFDVTSSNEEETGEATGAALVVSDVAGAPEVATSETAAP